mmetsp:Transcript_10569/g.17688  ORF Transcript_10569/g.17688 Transcript_10569/m.17688 type:complete len:126 (-) Transcript_10569:70-447(-)
MKTPATMKNESTNLKSASSKSCEKIRIALKMQQTVNKADALDAKSAATSESSSCWWWFRRLPPIHRFRSTATTLNKYMVHRAIKTRTTTKVIPATKFTLLQSEPLNSMALLHAHSFSTADESDVG